MTFYYSIMLAKGTYVMRPHDAMLLGVGLDVALKVDIVALFNVVRTQGGAQRQGDLRRI